MKKTLLLISMVGLLSFSPAPTGSILDKIDRNMSSKNRIVESTMIIHGKRTDRTITAKTWSEGTRKSYTEYLSPATEKGTKMLKLEDKLWIYSPATDRTIQISGNMLRQSVMGSDLSYEDMMDDRSMKEVYSEKVLGTEAYDGRGCYRVELNARVEDIAYHRQVMWVDSVRYVPLKQELYARSGQLLKRIEFRDVRQVQGRWFPHTMIYKDMLKEGKGTEFRISSILFDQVIPEYMFTKAVLKK